MKEDREHARSNCEEHCMLNLRGWYYPAAVKNVSLSGALVTSSKLLTGLHAGDTCSILLVEDSCCEYSCTVVRVDGHDVALRIFHGNSENAFADILDKLNDSPRRSKRRDNVGRVIEIYSAGISTPF